MSQTIAEVSLIPQTELSSAKRALLDKWRRGQPAKPTGGVIPRRNGSHPAPLSFGQQQLWFFDQLQPGSALYNVPVAMRLSGSLEVPALQKALDSIVVRHEILRTRFGGDGPEPLQYVDPARPVALCLFDLRQLPQEARDSEAKRLVAE